MPGRTADSDLMMFVRAARSMAEFAGICDGSSSNTEFRKPAERDDTTQNALDVVSGREGEGWVESWRDGDQWSVAGRGKAGWNAGGMVISD